MRDFIVRISSWLLCLAGFGAVVSCDDYVMGAPEYGTPYASYEIKGKVTDEEGSPVKGIMVLCEAVGEDVSYTGDDGGFTLSGGGFPQEEVSVVFKDVDAEQNGGLFSEKTVDVLLEHVQDGEGSWDYGSYGADIDVMLARLESSEDN